MNAARERVFEAKPAAREATGLLVSVVSPSGGGKTCSGLRLATGFQRVIGGDVYVLDTENGRALHYADAYKFQHVRFSAPFSPLDYLEAIRYCAKAGAKTIMVDSMSHEHDGAGGVLEWHDREVQRLMQLWKVDANKAQLPAWGEPKRARKKLINEMLQLNVNLILTFRAKEKLEIRRGKEPIELGWMPICGEEFLYEMTLQMLLEPGSEGTPTWQTDYPGERAIIKLPQQFKEFFGEPKQIDEDLGEKLAQWAAGGVKPAPELDTLIKDFAQCTTDAELKKLEQRRGTAWKKTMPAGYRARVKAASDAAIARVTGDEAGEPKADAATWAETLRGATTRAELAAAMAGMSAAYGTNPPDAVIDAYEDARERLGEAEAREGEERAGTA